MRSIPGIRNIRSQKKKETFEFPFIVKLWVHSVEALLWSCRVIQRLSIICAETFIKLQRENEWSQEDEEVNDQHSRLCLNRGAKKIKF